MSHSEQMRHQNCSTLSRSIQTWPSKILTLSLSLSRMRTHEPLGAEPVYSHRNLRVSMGPRKVFCISILAQQLLYLCDTPPCSRRKPPSPFLFFYVPPAQNVSFLCMSEQTANFALYREREREVVRGTSYTRIWGEEREHHFVRTLPGLARSSFW